MVGIKLGAQWCPLLYSCVTIKSWVAPGYDSPLPDPASTWIGMKENSNLMLILMTFVCFVILGQFPENWPRKSNFERQHMDHKNVLWLPWQSNLKMRFLNHMKVGCLTIRLNLPGG